MCLENLVIWSLRTRVAAQSSSSWHCSQRCLLALITLVLWFFRPLSNSSTCFPKSNPSCCRCSGYIATRRILSYNKEHTSIWGWPLCLLTICYGPCVMKCHHSPRELVCCCRVCIRRLLERATRERGLSEARMLIRTNKKFWWRRQQAWSAHSRQLSMAVATVPPMEVPTIVVHPGILLAWTCHRSHLLPRPT